jgi:hypothetical protein
MKDDVYAIRIQQITYKELVEIAESGLHVHVKRQDGTDYCRKCGHDLRHPIHAGIKYFKEQTNSFLFMKMRK